MDDRIESAALKAEQSTVLRAMARGGYLASGLIHALIGVLAIVLVVRHGRGQADQIGALEAIASAPLGLVALWVLASLLAALGVFHAAHGFALTEPSRRRRWGRRVAEWGQGVAFLTMACIAMTVAWGARPDPDESARDASRGLLGVPGGPLLLAAFGLGVGVAGIVWMVMGVRRGFRKHLELPQGGSGRAVSTVGAAGFIAKGIALIVVSVSLLGAAVRHDPESAGALDAAVASLRGMPYGEWLMLAIGAGFILYGLFCALRAWFARL